MCQVVTEVLKPEKCSRCHVCEIQIRIFLKKISHFYNQKWLIFLMQVCKDAHNVFRTRVCSAFSGFTSLYLCQKYTVRDVRMIQTKSKYLGFSGKVT